MNTIPKKRLALLGLHAKSMFFQFDKSVCHDNMQFTKAVLDIATSTFIKHAASIFFFFLYFTIQYVITSRLFFDRIKVKLLVPLRLNEVWIISYFTLVPLLQTLNCVAFHKKQLSRTP